MNTLRRTFFSILLALIISTFGVFFAQQHGSSPASEDVALAGTTDNLSGWVWGGDYIDVNGNNIQDASEPTGGIGWISFNCTDQATCGTSNYGVRIDETNRFITNGVGTFSGYAWAGNKDDTAIPPTTTFGWISFNQTDLIGCPDGNCVAQINWTTGRVTGWAKALAGGTAGSGGWDGWIKLSDFSGTYPYGVKLNTTTNNFSGYAWGGGDVVGWINFNPSGGGCKFTPMYNPPTNGCGTASGAPTATSPATNLCSDNSLPPVTNNPAVLPSTPAYWGWVCTNAGSPVSCTAPRTQCSDGIDNDGDGQIDGADSGCKNSSGAPDTSKNSERNFQFKEF